MLPVQDLLRYNASAPRYTSYPPANLFAALSDDALVRRLWEESNTRQPRNLSFYFHVPFCPRRCHFCGCNSEVTGSSQAVEAYFHALEQEMQQRLLWLDTARPLTQVHFGGGTPNAVPVTYLAICLERLAQRFHFSSTAEIAVECNPAHLSRQRLQELSSAGFNRISIGIQDFNVQVLSAVGREPPAYPVTELLQDCRCMGFRGINLDLIYGLPGQSRESFASTVQTAIDLRPDRVALFSYAHVPWVKDNQRHMDGMVFPGPELKVEMFLDARERFLNAGYVWVGMDHFVLPHDPLGAAAEQGTLHRNFQGYCERSATGQVYGFGCSAITQLDNAYIQNVHASADYTHRALTGEALTVRCHVLSEKEKVLREAIAALMCNGRLEWSSGLDDASENGWSRLCALDKEGLLHVDGDSVVATDAGRLVVRYLAMQLDPLMRGVRLDSYSKTL